MPSDAPKRPSKAAIAAARKLLRSEIEDLRELAEYHRTCGSSLYLDAPQSPGRQADHLAAVLAWIETTP